MRTFADKTRQFPQDCENRTLSVSLNDKAADPSRFSTNGRVGMVPPLHGQIGVIAGGHASTGREDRDALTPIAGTTGILLGGR